MSRVWLIRHAASSAAAGSAIGLTDLPLSDVGHEQARSLASELASRPLVRIVSSDRRRALATANMIAVPHSGLRVESSSALREIDFGAWEGRSLNDLWVEDPAAARAWEDDIHATPASLPISSRMIRERSVAPSRCRRRSTSVSSGRRKARWLAV